MPLSGAMVAPFVAGTDLRALLSLGAKLVRYEIATTPALIEAWTPEQWREWVRSHCNHVDTLIPILAEYKASLVLDLHTPPNGFDPDGRAKIFNSRQELQWQVADAWAEMASRYNAVEQVLCYDILNEPAGYVGQVEQFYRFVTPYIRAQSQKRISISSCYGIPKSIHDVRRFDSGQTWYQVHFYTPLSFTHQGINGLPVGVRYNRSAKRSLRDAVRSVRSWQRENNAIIFVGEAGCSSAALERDRAAYYEDVLGYARDYGWHITLHAWREAAWWTLESPDVLKVIKRAWRTS